VIRVVYFTKNYAKYFKANDSERGRYQFLENCVINPDLSKVKHLRPEYWKLSADGKSVVPMSDWERTERDADIKANGYDYSFSLPKKRGRVYRLYRFIKHKLTFRRKKNA
jgi:hypothetical protein